MEIRNAKTGDERPIAEVIIHTWKESYRGIVPENFLSTLTAEKHVELFRNHILNQTETILVLENSQKEIVGMASGGQDRSGQYDCELVAIYILPEYQKKGFGRLLFKTLIEAHKENRYNSMIIWTFKDNRDRMFYENLGGIVCEEKTHAFDGKEIPIAGYVWKNINDICFG